jgi:hypothetical protein
MTTTDNPIKNANNLMSLRGIISFQEKQLEAKIQKIAAAIANEVPISNSTLEELKSIASHHANELLNHHPGAKTSRRIESVKIALETLRVALLDLYLSLDLFHTASEKPGYFNPANKSQNETFDRKINKEIFSASCAAKALADHCGNLQRKITVTNYDLHLAKLRQKDQDFIFKLRNNLNHGTWFDANWLVKNDKVGRSTHYTLKKYTLLLSDDWSVEAKQFILEADEHIYVRSLFTEYERRVEEFYDWYLPAAEQTLPVDSFDHQRCCDILKRHQARQGYSFLISVCLQKNNFDSYAHLTNFFDETQLNAIFALPNHSTQQVDLIISLLDQNKICDDALRRQVYQLFKVDAVS